VTEDGTKIPVGLRLGDTENKTVVTALLADIVDRGLSYPNGLLVVIDGAKALAAGVKSVFGDQAVIIAQTPQRRWSSPQSRPRSHRRPPRRSVRRPRPRTRDHESETARC